MIWFFEELKEPSFRKLIGAIVIYAKSPARIESLKRNASLMSHQISTEDVLSFVNWLENFDVDMLDTAAITASGEIANQLETMHALHFMIRVMIPCMYLFGETHYALFQKAKAGNVDSICKLLLIDKSVIGTPQVTEKFHNAFLNDSGTYGKIQAALVGSNKAISLKKTKGMVAAYISESSKAFGQNLTAPQIQELFDFASSAKGSESLIDTDLPDTPEAFAKNIQRKAPLYTPLFKLDKK